jgi:hypothetical protein
LESPRGPRFFGHASTWSELPPGLIQSRGTRKAVTLQLFGPRFDVELNLIIQFPLELRALAEVLHPPHECFEHVHTVLMTL